MAFSSLPGTVAGFARYSQKKLEPFVFAGIRGNKRGGIQQLKIVAVSWKSGLVSMLEAVEI
jgi:hypothetical protein